ncbi:MFS transporter [Peterkaempfera bronchialis]|uniref:MFS transporter n=1 Tax=Peterkaempfera bronchialis TaxID=2126346 RepID=A0A345T2A7_9ACTN|nr:MFS transporter [Peterkaempfera bronchialis]AXI80112.1 MFS transporter [Peterkaempfera bronchialis]
MAGVLAGRRAALLLLTGVELIVFLDVSIINLAMPTIGAALGMSVVALAWVSTAYQVTFGGFQLGAGRTADLFGRRMMFRVGLALFTGASLLAGLTSTGWVLITARAIQGVGAAVLIPAELALLTAMFTEPEARRRAFGVWSAMGAVGAAGGVALGGAIVQLLGWEWVFLVNVPIGVAGLLLSTRLLPADGIDRRSVSRRRLDLPGMLTGTGCLLLVVYVATMASEGGLDTVQWLLAALAVVLGVSFVLIERRVAEPLLPFRIFRERNITGSSAANFVVGATHVPAFVFISLYFQEVHGYNAIRAGLAVLPIALLGIPVSRTLIPIALKRLGPRPVLAYGMAFLAVALFIMGRLPVDADYVTGFLPAAVIFAVGLPACFVGSTMPGVRAADPAETGIVSGVVNTTQRLGAGLGVAVLASVAGSHTASVGGDRATALNAGFHWAFLGASGLAVLGVVVALAIIRPEPEQPPEPTGDAAAATSPAAAD